MTAVGSIARVERENIDKSGRGPRYLYTFFVRAEHTEGVPAGAEIPDELPLRAKDAELERMTGSSAPFAAGDRIEVTARAIDPRPASLYLIAARKI